MPHLSRLWPFSPASACRPARRWHNLPPPQNSGASGADLRLIVVPPGPISLGALPPGRPARGRLTLKNESAEAISIDRVETSCPCLSVLPLPARVEAGSERSLTVAFDPTAEPDFRGGLAVELTGRGSAGTILFGTRVDLDVTSDHPPPGGETGR